MFTDVALQGNPLAVFTDARGLDTATMQRIANELNLSETTFVFPAERGGTARVRIFTPGVEMPFAGHPTLGTAYVLRDEGRGGDALVLEENAGDIAVRVAHEDGVERFWLTSPPIAFGERVERSVAAAALGLGEDDLLPGVPPEFADVGPVFLYVALRDAATVDRAFFDARVLHAALPHRPSFLVYAFAPHERTAYARMFADDAGVVEDPATGSATGPLLAYLVRHGLAPHADGLRIAVEQGVKLGRRSVLHALLHGDGRIEVGGSVVPVAEATLTLPAAAPVRSGR